MGAATPSERSRSLARRPCRSSPHGDLPRRLLRGAVRRRAPGSRRHLLAGLPARSRPVVLAGRHQPRLRHPVEYRRHDLRLGLDGDRPPAERDTNQLKAQQIGENGYSDTKAIRSSRRARRRVACWLRTTTDADAAPWSPLSRPTTSRAALIGRCPPRAGVSGRIDVGGAGGVVSGCRSANGAGSSSWRAVATASLLVSRRRAARGAGGQMAIRRSGASMGTGSVSLLPLSRMRERDGLRSRRRTLAARPQRACRRHV